MHSRNDKTNHTFLLVPACAHHGILLTRLLAKCSASHRVKHTHRATGKADRLSLGRLCRVLSIKVVHLVVNRQLSAKAVD